MAKNTVDGFEGLTYESIIVIKIGGISRGLKILAFGKLVIINHYNESDCDGVYRDYKNTYNNENISFICEDRNLKKYKHYN